MRSCIIEVIIVIASVIFSSARILTEVVAIISISSPGLLPDAIISTPPCSAENVIELARIMLRQGYKYNMLKMKFKQFAKNNVAKWAYYGKNFLDLDFIDTIIPKNY